MARGATGRPCGTAGCALLGAHPAAPRLMPAAQSSAADTGR